MLNKHSRLDILLALDGSEHARAALALTRSLPLPPGSAVSVVAVLVPREAGFRYNPLTAALAEAQNALQEASVNLTTELLSGYPADQIIAHAERTRPDLIVMGAKGLRATLGILLGGVAQQVVEHSSSPCLIVRAPYDGLRRILLAVDGSADSQRAVEFVSAFPFPADARLEVIHVLPPIPAPEFLAASLVPDVEFIRYRLPPEEEADLAGQVEEEKRRGKAILRETFEELKAAGVAAESVLRGGDAATEIISHGQEHQIDLIVAGERGLSHARGWRLGEVSRKLVHYAGRSVLIVKTPEQVPA